MEAIVEGIGIVGGFGSDIKEFSDTLVRGESRVQSVPFQSDEGTGEMPAFLADTARLDKYVPKKALRRVDHHAKMAILGAYLALEDAGRLDSDRKGLGIVVASGYGAGVTTFAFLDSFLTSSDAYSSPTHFSNSVHNAAAAHISIFLGATGPCLTVSQFEMSVASALITALHWLEEERVERVLFGAVDEYCDVLAYCWRRFFGVNQAAAGIEPFLFDRQTAILGEGAAFFLLSREGGSGKSYGRIAGVESGCPACNHPSLEDDTLFIVGADGNKEYGQEYVPFVGKGMEVASYTPLYGSFPTNQAFDMAAALLMMKEQRRFGAPFGITLPPSARIAREEQRLDASRICCVKLGKQGESGIISLSRD